MRHTHLLSKLSLAMALIATAGVCQATFSAPVPIGPIVFAEETPTTPISMTPATEPANFTSDTPNFNIEFIAPAPLTQQSDFFPMIWSWMQTYPAWAGFFCVAILMTLVHFGQTMWGVEEMEATEERPDRFMEEKPSFSQAMPEVEVHVEEMQEDSYESSYDSDAETESQTEKPRVTVSKFD